MGFAPTTGVPWVDQAASVISDLPINAGPPTLELALREDGPVPVDRRYEVSALIVAREVRALCLEPPPKTDGSSRWQVASELISSGVTQICERCETVDVPPPIVAAKIGQAVRSEEVAECILALAVYVASLEQCWPVLQPPEAERGPLDPPPPETDEWGAVVRTLHGFSRNQHQAIEKLLADADSTVEDWRRGLEDHFFDRNQGRALEIAVGLINYLARRRSEIEASQAPVLHQSVSTAIEDLRTRIEQIESPGTLDVPTSPISPSYTSVSNRSGIAVGDVTTVLDSELDDTAAPGRSYERAAWTITADVIPVGPYPVLPRSLDLAMLRELRGIRDQLSDQAAAETIGRIIGQSLFDSRPDVGLTDNLADEWSKWSGAGYPLAEIVGGSLGQALFPSRPYIKGPARPLASAWLSEIAAALSLSVSELRPQVSRTYYDLIQAVDRPNLKAMEMLWHALARYAYHRRDRRQLLHKLVNASKDHAVLHHRELLNVLDPHHTRTVAWVTARLEKYLWERYVEDIEIAFGPLERFTPADATALLNSLSGRQHSSSPHGWMHDGQTPSSHQAVPDDVILPWAVEVRQTVDRRRGISTEERVRDPGQRSFPRFRAPTRLRRSETWDAAVRKDASNLRGILQFAAHDLDRVAVLRPWSNAYSSEGTTPRNLSPSPPTRTNPTSSRRPKWRFKRAMRRAEIPNDRGKRSRSSEPMMVTCIRFHGP